jgi:hypothetical protein
MAFASILWGEQGQGEEVEKVQACSVAVEDPYFFAGKNCPTAMDVRV